MKKIFRWTLVLTCIVTLTQACKKDYYADGGLANPHYNGTIYDYLTEKKLYFDTIKQIIDLAGLKDMMTSDTITFFAPTDDVIRVAMNDLNAERYFTMKDSVKISDLGPEVWRKFLSMYIMKGKRVAGSFPRVSTENITAFPGINYIMLDGYILNIGLEYTSYNGVEAVGPRILMVTDVTFDPTNFRNNPKVRVVSSDIQPKNGVIHALSISHQFGFRRGEFTRIAGDYLK
ncbi:fasciclin domain-containing protein [Chitinophaga niabensis]|uniref:Fasciclin domain-containing protein n=1 Tax=Chitinophaga niabensis TaxID=536979 RepID=A0A1N6EG44_9BACT|nr:fasciclin domain-containing protein [Chitinophaga niabensis]SIN81989.1 Fasciclin domain-containing protein [Chitinophaga niabensis]